MHEKIDEQKKKQMNNKTQMNDTENTANTN